MKKLFLILMMWFAAAGISVHADSIHVTGYVTDSVTGLAVPSYLVHIDIDSSSTGFTYHGVTGTNANGFYADTIEFSTGGAPTGVMQVWVLDCTQSLHIQYFSFSPGHLTFNQNFLICTSPPPPPCHADFYPSLPPPPVTPMTVHFINTSVGANGPWQWMFGDGTGSTLFDPTHTYSFAGTYYVTLAMGDSAAGGCFSTITHEVIIVDSTGQCQAQFTWMQDSTQNQNIVHFFDQSTYGVTAWAWNFGDGTISNEQNPTHLFTTHGTFYVCLTITANNQQCHSTECHYVTVYSPSCHANFYPIPPPPPVTPLTVHFINTSVGAGGPWQWLFGDGTSSDLFEPTHTFANPGYYHVHLTMGDSAQGGCWDSISHMIFVEDSTGGQCHSNFTWNIDSTYLSHPVQFTDLSTPAPISWLWNFGDSLSGAANISTMQNPVHVYSGNGVFHPCLTITTANQCTSVECKEIHIGPPPPPPCESWFTHMNNFLQVSFEGHTPQNAPPSAYNWNFGDGTGGTGKNVDHTYAAAGLYEVHLTTITQDSNQCTFTSMQHIFVGDTMNLHQVYGQVFEGNFPLPFGMAMIFSNDTMPGGQPFFAASPIDSMGVYMFPYVPNGHFVIWAMPFDSTGGFLPTFYEHTLYWQQATVIELGNPQNPYNINLIHAGNMPVGPGGITGHVNTSGLKSVSVDKIAMLVTDEQGNVLGFRKVTPSGTFDFSGMAYGTYYLLPELPNTTSEQVKVVLSAAAPVANVVMTFNGSTINGISEQSAVESIIAYPNPVKDVLNLNLKLNASVNANAEIYSFTGQVVSRQALDLAKGANVVKLDVSLLNSGLYTLRITSADGIKITQKFVKE